MLLYYRNNVTIHIERSDLVEELISKKELLEKYGISYGALYRWKRMGLIPEEWFEKKSAVTGQETFFPRAAITERIETILALKDEMSLEEIAEKLKGNEPVDSSLLKIVWDGGTTQIPLDKVHSIAVIVDEGNVIVDLTSVLGKTAVIDTDSIKEQVNEAMEKAAAGMNDVEATLKQMTQDFDKQIEEARKVINDLMNRKGNY